MLRAPIIKGTRYTATACITGTANMNIMAVPWLLKSWL